MSDFSLSFFSDDKITVQSALAHLIDCGMTKADYEKHCKLVNKSKRILPPYSHLEGEKLKCRPEEITTVGDHEVVVPLQNLLDHTVSRIFEFRDIQDQIDRLSEMNEGQLHIRFFYKYGMDGSQGHLKPKSVEH